MLPRSRVCVQQEQSCWERPTFQSSLSHMSPTILSMDEPTIPTIFPARQGGVVGENPLSSQQGDHLSVWVLTGLVAFAYHPISVVLPVSSQRQGVYLSLAFYLLPLAHPLDYAMLVPWPGMWKTSLSRSRSCLE